MFDMNYSRVEINGNLFPSVQHRLDPKTQKLAQPTRDSSRRQWLRCWVFGQAEGKGEICGAMSQSRWGVTLT